MRDIKRRDEPVSKTIQNRDPTHTKEEIKVKQQQRGNTPNSYDKHADDVVIIREESELSKRDLQKSQFQLSKPQVRKLSAVRAWNRFHSNVIYTQHLIRIWYIGIVMQKISTGIACCL